MAEFDLTDIYNRVFGYVAEPYPIGLPGNLSPSNLLPLQSLEPIRGVFDTKSQLGSRLRMPTKLKRYVPGRGIENDIENTSYQWVQLPNEPIISVDGNKQVTTTTIQRGREKTGTVKEERNLGDYRIRIEGIIYNEQSNDFPSEQLRSIKRLIEHQGPLLIENTLCTELGITQITVMAHYFRRRPEHSIRIQPYTIVAISDFDFELNINDS